MVLITFEKISLSSKILITLFQFFLVATLAAQDKVVILQNADELDVKQRWLNDLSDNGVSFMDDFMSHFNDQGYLLAYWDTITNTPDSLKLHFETGPRTHWLVLKTDSIDPFIMQGAGLKPAEFDGKVFRYSKVLETMQALLKFAENNGYPFATVRLINVELVDTTFSAELSFNKNRLIVFDTMTIAGDVLLSDNYLSQFTGIHPGEPYNEQLIKALDQSLKELPFARHVRNSTIKFSGDQAKPVLFLDERNANRFDLVIGFLPNNEITGRFVVTGQGMLALQNAFGQGEMIDIRFSKLESSTKSLNIAARYPYLPSIPIGLDASIDLFLKDSTFLERRLKTGVLYQFSGNEYLKVFASWYNSTVLEIDTSSVISSKLLPSQIDMQIRTYGLELSTERLDYKFNPTSGWEIILSAAAGRKTINKNPAITGLSDPFQPEFDFETLYDSLLLNSLAFEYSYNVSRFLPLGESATILLQVQGAANLNDQLFTNELYRIGGNTILRGFDELALFVSEYHMLTSEIRYLISRNGYAGLFVDLAYTVNRAVEHFNYDLPIGFGAGMSFETKAGIFGLSYALGRQQDNPILFRNAKIHFGYLNYF